jgi:hypothetical protein
LQRKSYELLQWMAAGVAKGFIRIDTAHRYATLPEAAADWIVAHFNDIPLRARPDKIDIPDFSRLFATYLENSFDLIAQPGKQRKSDCGCLCPLCAYLVDAPNLKTKKVTSADRNRAFRMKRRIARSLARDLGLTIFDEDLESFINDKSNHASLSLVTWADDLLARLSGAERLDGSIVGAAPLVLWRGFAWTENGSPRKDFKLTVEAIELALGDVTSKLKARFTSDPNSQQ